MVGTDKDGFKLSQRQDVEHYRRRQIREQYDQRLSARMESIRGPSARALTDEDRQLDADGRWLLDIRQSSISRPHNELSPLPERVRVYTARASGVSRDTRASDTSACQSEEESVGTSDGEEEK